MCWSGPVHRLTIHSIHTPLPLVSDGPREFSAPLRMRERLAALVDVAPAADTEEESLSLRAGVIYCGVSGTGVGRVRGSGTMRRFVVITFVLNLKSPHPQPFPLT